MNNDKEWDPAQRKIIESSVDDRILVDAGPGTGKTAVACARVAWLIDRAEVLPGNIWLISFTRTAIQEIRSRIQDSLEDEGDAFSVRIATLDSHAWKIHSGFDRNAEILGSYDDNIEKLTEKIREDRDGVISEYLKTVEHIIVDEAQDIVGIRADLILEIINKLSSQCGVTVFSDDAQAIYGFSLDETAKQSGKRLETLSERIRKNYHRMFNIRSLNKVFRTQSPILNHLFTNTRNKVLKPTKNPKEKLQKICTEIRNRADSNEIPRPGDKNITYSGDSFILFRTRAEVLLASGFLGISPHRIRMSGLPQCIYPWIGACLSEHTKSTVTCTQFNDYWGEKVEDSLLENGVRCEDAWEQLVRLAGTSRKAVDMKNLRQRLGAGKPPADFCPPEIGTSGPIIGTIHAAKGREAAKVHLMMPALLNGNPESDTDYDEETRIVFVGATRAREWLGVGNGYFYHFARKLEPSGRVYKLTQKKMIQVQIGMENDIDAMGIAGRQYYPDAETVYTNQERLYEFAGKISKAHAVADHECAYNYRVIPGDSDDDIAVLSGCVNSDLWAIAKIISGRRPPETLKFLRIYGLRTVVLSPDSPVCGKLHEPWSRSGIMLAPVLLGYTTAAFPWYRRRSVSNTHRRG